MLCRRTGVVRKPPPTPAPRKSLWLQISYILGLTTPNPHSHPQDTHRYNLLPKHISFNFYKLAEDLGRIFSQLGSRKEILNSPWLLIPLTNTRSKKIKSWILPGSSTLDLNQKQKHANFSRF